MDKEFILESVKELLEKRRFNHILCDHFKIGKTTQALKSRFAENYEGEYDCIELLFDAGDDGALIDWLEEEMIQYCRENYSKECDNEQVGGGPNCAENASTKNTAKLYVVFR